MKKFTSALLIAIACFIYADTKAQPPRFSVEHFISDTGDTLNYRLLFPDADPGRKYPLVIFLHGSGERGSDNDAQLKWGVMNFATDEMMSLHPAFIIAPQCPAGMTWSNFNRTNASRAMTLLPTPSKPMELVIALIQQMKKNESIDTSRIYITGLSMGGFGTFDAIERYPHLFAAAMPVCGGGDTSRAASIAHIPVWIAHGSEDATVNPQFSVDMLQALMQAGAHPGFSMYPETGHFSWLAAYTNKPAMEWLFRQRK
ncbi:prolyl oligopeptidase family serine peptidase [Parafilimonas sp.]|uniref:carboxylesterase family protein n=1 Tax=Parafilimonas sp. TaxID=1969739 RepID=UPI0039E7100E